MKTERYLWISVILVLIFIVVLSIFTNIFRPNSLDSHTQFLSAFDDSNTSDPSSGHSDAEKLKILAEIYGQIKTKYLDYENNKLDEMIFAGIDGMVNSLDDEHTSFLDPDSYSSLMEDTAGEFGGLGIYIQMMDDRLTVIEPMENTPAIRAGIRPGDIISAIEGKETYGMDINEAVSMLKGEAKTDVTITVNRKGYTDPFDVTLTREKISIQTVRSKMIQWPIGYIRIQQFSKETDLELRKAIQDLLDEGMEKLVLDLRNNPGGLLDSATKVSNIFIAKGKIVEIRGKHNYLLDVQRAVESKCLLPTLPLIVLVNKYSASGSEIVAGVIQDTNRGLLIGTQTFGKGSVQDLVPLSYEDRSCGLKLTVAKYYTPAGQQIHKKGLTPDIIIEEPEISPADMLVQYELHEKGLIQEFLQQHPDYKQIDVDQFRQELADQCLIISDYYLRLILESEKHRTSRPLLFDDLELDVQLIKALELFETNEYEQTINGPVTFYVEN